MESWLSLERMGDLEASNQPNEIISGHPSAVVQCFQSQGTANLDCIYGTIEQSDEILLRLAFSMEQVLFIVFIRQVAGLYAMEKSDKDFADLCPQLESANRF
jgi:hypothetical protein